MARRSPYRWDAAVVNQIFGLGKRSTFMPAPFIVIRDQAGVAGQLLAFGKQCINWNSPEFRAFCILPVQHGDLVVVRWTRLPLLALSDIPVVTRLRICLLLRVLPQAGTRATFDHRA